MRAGVEVGGTFTDLVSVEDGRVRIAKVPTTPNAPDVGSLAAIDAADVDFAQLQDLVHGSTVALNALLQRKGARTAFVVTEGFRDLLVLQRHNRQRIYDLFYQKPQPVVARDDVFVVPERIAADGSVNIALDLDDVDSKLGDLLAGDYESIAICLLNAYANPDHERRLGEWLRKALPATYVTCSSDVTREFREYERASTTTVAAYIQPIADAYVARFDASLRERGFGGRFSVMQSNGGRLPVAGIKRNAVTMLFSGPAAGVTGAVHQAAMCGFRDLITFDMGGTSTDVCLVKGGVPELTTEAEIDGLPLRTPVLDIVTVGAGGGSIAWADEGGMLRVGPQSSGADPGPACYGRGGSQPTVTDAHLIRGSLRAEAFLGGEMSVDPALSENAFSALAKRFDLSLEAISDAVLRLADANIVRAIQLVSTERGRDPREFVLVPYGGAGPLHAARVAEALEIETLLIPPHAGVLSAFGLLAADYSRFYTRTRRTALNATSHDFVRTQFTEMTDEAHDELAELGLSQGVRASYTLDMRYVGQAFEVPVHLDEGTLASIDTDGLAARFADVHRQLYGFANDGAAAEIVNFKLGVAVPPEEIPVLSQANPATDAEHRVVSLFENREPQDCIVFARECLDRVHHGPALIEDRTSTVYVPAGWSVAVGAGDNLIMRRDK